MIKEKYSISECLWTDIIKALNNEYDNSQNILLRNNTPKELVKLGVKDLKMMTSVGHLKQNILTIEEAEKKKLSTNNKHWHGLGINTYVNAIKSIDKPVRIYQWLPNNENKYNKDNYVILTNIIDNNNLKVIIPIEINKEGNYNNEIWDINRISTVYGKKDVYKYFERKVIDKKMIQLYR